MPPSPPAPDRVGTAVVQGRHGPTMYLRGDVYIGRSLEVYGEFSEIEVEAIARLLRPGDTVIDAGANIGALTVPIARAVGPTGRVIAFEPQRTLFHLLCGNVALNELENVETHRAALGDAEGAVEQPRLGYRDKANFGGIAVGDDAQKIDRVPMTRIDDLGLERLRLLKADVEGSELGVVSGAVETIRRCRPLLWIENDRREKSPALIARILGLGYRLWWHVAPLYNPGNFKRVAENVFGNTVSVNLLGVPTEVNATIAGLPPVQGPDHWWKPSP